MEFLKNSKSHPNAETIYKHIKNELPTITLATIYRNLNQLANNGKILRFKVGNEFRFDGDISTHQHCICKKCGCITDTFHKNINKYALKHMNSDRFTPTEVNIIFSGYCKKCGGNKK